MIHYSSDWLINWGVLNGMVILGNLFFISLLKYTNLITCLLCLKFEMILKNTLLFTKGILLK